MEATKHGQQVAVVERLPLIGGNCTHVGTIPSKSLRSAISRLTEVNSNRYFREAGVTVNLGFRDLRRGATSVIEKQVGMRRSFYDRNDVDVYHGQASFRDNESVVVELADGRKQVLVASSFMIATGSRPYRPDDVDFGHPRLLPAIFQLFYDGER